MAAEDLVWLLELGAAPGIHADMSLSDAGVDSLLLLEWAVAIEDETGRLLSDDLLSHLHSVRDLCHYRQVLTDKTPGH